MTGVVARIPQMVSSLSSAQGEFVVWINDLPGSSRTKRGRTAGESGILRLRQGFRGFQACHLDPSGESGLIPNFGPSASRTDTA